MLCDGAIDCPDGEDEETCDDVTCPGLLHCREDNLCVHPVDICDGVVHCLLSWDDEKLCNTNQCPESCICRGAATYCHTLMPAAINVSINTTAFVAKSVIVKYSFNLRHCQKLMHLAIQNSSFYKKSIFKHMFAKLAHLQYLSLFNNKIVYIEERAFADMYKVKFIDLQGNYFKVISTSMLTGFQLIKHLDLSYLFIQELQTGSFDSFTPCLYLNISNNILSVLHEDMFRGLIKLTILDLRYNLISAISQLLLLSMNYVRVYMDYPFQCCHSTASQLCITRETNPLLRSPCVNIVDLYVIRVINTCCSAFALPTLAVILYVVYNSKKAHTVSFLQQQQLLSNSIPAVYTLFLSSLSVFYHGEFAYLNTSWLSSFWCKSLRFIITLSFIQSRLITCLFVINQLLSTRFLFKTRHFSKRHIYLMVSAAWLISILFSSIQNSITSKNIDIHCFPFALSSRDTTFHKVFIPTILFLLLLVISMEVYLYANILEFVEASHKAVRSSKSSNSSLATLKSNAIIVVATEVIIWLAMVIIPFYSYFDIYDRYLCVFISFYIQLSCLIPTGILGLRIVKSKL